MKEFNLNEWLKDKSRKVTTRLGNREVRIICCDRKNNNNKPIITLMIDPDGNEYITFHTKNGFVDETEKHIDKRDLFFADEEEQLTEFEKAVDNIINYPHFQDEQAVKQFSKTLLDLARKELEKEDWRTSLRVYKTPYEQGKQDALKDLPKWKKDCFHNINSVFDDTLFYNGYYIDINELEKLPKEE